MILLILLFYYLRMTTNYEQYIDNSPYKTNITFPYYFDELVKAEYIPDYVEDICFEGGQFKLDQNSFRNTNIKCIIFNEYNEEFELGVLPDTLEELHLGYIYNLPIRKNVLPYQLKELSIGVCSKMRSFGNFNQPKENVYLPPSVEEVTIIWNSNNITNQNIQTYKKGTLEFHNRYTVVEMAKNANDV